MFKTSLDAKREGGGGERGKKRGKKGVEGGRTREPP